MHNTACGKWGKIHVIKFISIGSSLSIEIGEKESQLWIKINIYIYDLI